MKLSDKVFFKNFNIIKDDFKVLNQKEIDLYEDMFQAEFISRNLVIDIGWYGEDIESGKFIIYLIQNENWDNPILKLFSRDLDNLTLNLEGIIKILNNDLDEMGKV